MSNEISKMIWQLMKILHFVGLVSGVSGATVLALLFRKTLRAKVLIPAVFKISRTTMNLIWGGIGALAVSGIVLSIRGSYFPNAGLIFWLKLFLVALILGITAYIEICVYQKVKKLNASNNLKAIISLCKKSNWLCWISMILWYAVIIFSVYSTL